MIPSTTSRVLLNTHETLNEQVRQRIRDKVTQCAESHPQAIECRLNELEHEWDIDRAIMLAFAGMGTSALALGLRNNWRWRFPLGAQIGFLLMHSIVGWSPPAAVLRRLGFRTRQEIEAEQVALSSIRGSGLGVSNA